MRALSAAKPLENGIERTEQTLGQVIDPGRLELPRHEPGSDPSTHTPMPSPDEWATKFVVASGSKFAEMLREFQRLTIVAMGSSDE